MQKARILVADDDPAIRKVVADRVRALGHLVETAVDGGDALTRADSFEPDLVLVDVMMPELDGFGVLEKLRARERAPEVVMITAHGTIERAVEAIRRGAADFVPKPFDGGHLDCVVTRVLDTARLRQRVERLEGELAGRHSLVTGGSKAMREVVSIAERAAASTSTVLLLGESGCGKEVLARHIHRSGPRREGPFVAVNCAMLGQNLAESELFGHAKGAFTGAHRSKPGRIEMASGGTLFLDELGELPVDVQAKLLRVLQERQFERVGGTKTLDADVRVIAATNEDLRASVEAGRFRDDLYYRIAVVSIRIPPLRERPEDLDALVDHALVKCGRAASKPGVTISDAARAAMGAYSWPGNVRELHNVIERAIVLTDGFVIEPDDLPEELLETSSPAPGPHEAPSVDDHGEILPFREAVVRAKREIILRALARTGGHQTKAADLLGTTQPYLARLMKNLKIRGR